ncbi:MAG: A/G-specific adenine glycosylase [Verrucomicrobia bacterium]|nr:A/G-specific adenine glycosylase [Verrucomicrobiota bacterium]
MRASRTAIAPTRWDGPGTPGDLAQSLLRWFSTAARDLPWRRTRNPYGIWVSEIMLQQTQVQTVIPYWNRWMEAFPDVHALAAAPEERVLKLWEGLGYYSRARNLHRAAARIVGSETGRFPDTVDSLLELPGIGRYTAGAVASIAFNRPAPILDGNVIRVLTRLLALKGDPRTRPLQEILWARAQDLVTASEGRGGVRMPWGECLGDCSALNQSLMELGATVCLPKNPRCEACPVRSLCRAAEEGTQERYPETAPRPAPIQKVDAAVVIEQKGTVWVRQRPAGGVNAGFWEFPGLELPDPVDNVRRHVARWLGVPEDRLAPLPPIRHAITRYRIRLESFHTTGIGLPAVVGSTGRWVDRRELEALAFTAAHRRIVRLLPKATLPAA